MVTNVSIVEPVLITTGTVAESATQLAGLLLDTLCVVLDCLAALGQSGALSFLPAGKFTDEGSVWPNKALVAKHCLA